MSVPGAQTLPIFREKADYFFRAARVAFLVLLMILPWEAVTSAREAALIAAPLLLALYLWFSKDLALRSTVLFWPLCFYAATAAFSLLGAVDFSYSLREMRAELLKGLIVFYTAVHIVDDEIHLRQVWLAMLASLAIMALAGLFFFFWHGGSLLHFAVRAGSLHSGYGGLGTYLVIVWPFLLLSLRAFKSTRLIPWLWVLGGLTIALAFATYNRAAWVALVVETGLVVLVLAKRRLRTAVIGGLVCLALGVGMFFLPGSRHGETWDRLWSDPSQVGGTAGDLLALWRHSWKEIESHPFTGIGLGRHSFSLAYPEFVEAHHPLLWHAHNMFVDVALQLGVQGLAAILLIFVVLITVLWPRSPPGPGDVVTCFAAAVAIMVMGFSIRNLTDDFFVKDSALLLWLLSGLALGSRYFRRPQAPSGGG
ncbi:MAG: O-antigen ligase family protein [Desulfarculaceae bacterium]|jgi:O-antigen ligase